LAISHTSSDPGFFHSPLGCKFIPGVTDGLVLVADFSMRCLLGTHIVYSGLAFGFGALCKSILHATTGLNMVESHTFFSMLVLLLVSFLESCADVFGIPVAIMLTLRKHRKALYDESHPEHEKVMYSLGGLYAQYEEKFWWFEMVIIMHKMFMT
jgi:hypothetical protein